MPSPMVRRDWTPEEDGIIATGRDAGEGPTAIAARLVAAGFTDRTFGAVQKRTTRESFQGKAEPEDATEELTREGTPDTQHISSRSATIKTLDDLLAYADVDLAVWEVERYTVNKWEMGAKLGEKGKERMVAQPLFQVKAWLRRNRKASAIVAVGERILSDIAEHAPQYPKYPPLLKTRDPHMLEVCAMDLHLGKLAWREEAGEDYDLTIARAVFEEALEDLIRKASGFPVDRILMPIGNDLLQIDNLQRTTTAGTPQDSDSRYAKLFQTAEQLMVYALDRLAAIAPVEGVIVPGNHDRQSAFTLGRVLEAWYRNTDRVTIDCSPRLRKYKRYGVNLIGYTHGSEEKPADLPLIMATEVPDLWAETHHREWHTGHFHKSKETRYTAGDSFNGVRHRILPALCSADAWHASKGYVGERRAAEGYLWSHENGYAGHFSTSILPDRRAA